jgi:hypothetical protein
MAATLESAFDAFTSEVYRPNCVRTGCFRRCYICVQGDPAYSLPRHQMESDLTLGEALVKPHGNFYANCGGYFLTVFQDREFRQRDPECFALEAIF